MILGIGVDIVEISRIRAALERFSDRFVERILGPDEIAYCRSYADPVPHVAARFAAKEAISKAFGTGFGAELGWLDLEIARHPSGAPFVRLHGAGQELFLRHRAKALHLSLSHADSYAVAHAILEA